MKKFEFLEGLSDGASKYPMSYSNFFEMYNNYYTNKLAIFAISK